MMGQRIGKDWHEDWYALLPPDIAARAYNYNGELAWTRADALAVVALLERHGYEIIGVDTWLLTQPGPTPLIDDWNERRSMPAAAFIEAFRWEPVEDANRGLDVHFNISTDR